MASLKELKGRINSVKSTQKITKAKKMVAAAKLRKAQAAAEAARPYAERLEGVVASLASKVGAADSAPRLLSGTGKSDTHLLLVLNSDRGLAGAFNSNIVKAARDKAHELQAAGKKVQFFLVGRKGRPVINRLFPGQIVEHYETTGIRDIGFDQASEIADKVRELFDAGAFDVAHLFYSKFRSALVQEATGQQLIPVPAPAEAPASSGAAVEYEPDEEAILADLTRFFASRARYESLGIPWRRGYLLYGPPGTGKTSLVTALGLLPLAIGMGDPGREIEGPMALVILGGLLTSMTLNLLVLPTLALRFGRFESAVDELGGGSPELAKQNSS